MQKKKGTFRKTKDKFPRTKAKDEALEVNSKPNDLSWYVVDEQILNDAARIPYSIPVGMPLTRRPGFTQTGVTQPSYDDAIPGLLVSHVMPGLGYAENASDSVNVAANSVYQFVRSRISGSRPYDAVDFMIYFGAMDSVFSFVTWITRLYGTVFTYHQSNRYLSRALVESQGVDYDDLLGNIAQFRQAMNVRIEKIKSLYIPSVLPIFKRHAWMFSNYYIEGESEKDQLYYHVPEGIYRFKYDADGAGMLEAYNLHDSVPITTAGLINVLDAMINPIYADEDFNRMSGDLLKAYEGNVFTVTQIPDIATVNLIYNEEVLLQFKNAKYKDVYSNSDRFYLNAFDYVQSTNKEYLIMNMDRHCLNTVCFLTNPSNYTEYVNENSDAQGIARLAAMWQNWSKPILLTTPHNNVTPGENMINTRLTLGFNIDPTIISFWNAYISNVYVGTEWPLYFEIYTYHRNILGNTVTLFHRKYEHSMIVNRDNINDVQQTIESQLPILSSFKYCPEIWINVEDRQTPTVYNAGRSVFEVDNYALIGDEVVEGLHNAAILGEYNIPRLSVGRQ